MNDKPPTHTRLYIRKAGVETTVVIPCDEIDEWIQKHIQEPERGRIVKTQSVYLADGYFTEVHCPASIWRDDNGTFWMSMSDIDPSEILDVNGIDMLVTALLEVRKLMIEKPPVEF